MLYLSYEDYHNTFGGLLTAQQYAVFGGPGRRLSSTG